MNIPLIFHLHAAVHTLINEHSLALSLVQLPSWKGQLCHICAYSKTCWYPCLMLKRRCVSPCSRPCVKTQTDSFLTPATRGLWFFKEVIKIRFLVSSLDFINVVSKCKLMLMLKVSWEASWRFHVTHFKTRTLWKDLEYGLDGCSHDVKKLAKYHHPYQFLIHVIYTTVALCISV